MKELRHRKALISWHSGSELLIQSILRVPLTFQPRYLNTSTQIHLNLFTIFLEENNLTRSIFKTPKAFNLLKRTNRVLHLWRSNQELKSADKDMCSATFAQHVIALLNYDGYSNYYHVRAADTIILVARYSDK